MCEASLSYNIYFTSIINIPYQVVHLSDVKPTLNFLTVLRVEERQELPGFYFELIANALGNILIPSFTFLMQTSRIVASAFRIRKAYSMFDTLPE